MQVNIFDDSYGEYERKYINELTDRYMDLKEKKSLKINKKARCKEKLLNELAKAVEYNETHPNNKYIRKLNPKALVDKNIISIFESTLTRTLGEEVNGLTTDIMVVQVFYFDVIKDLIINGFEYNGEKYRFLTASAGQIRTKKTVFIKESLWRKHEKSLMCGLTLDEVNAKGGANVNKFLAYLALSNSATDLWEDFDIDKCIVIPDFETEVNGDVDFIDDISFDITRQNMNISIEHTDGCGMMLPKISRKNFMVRLPWIKGLLASFDFRKFIEEKNCPSTIKDIYGVEHDVIAEDIQIIFTKSQFKMYKYYKDWEEYKRYFKEYNCQAGICNVEEKYIPDATINYQMLQTLTDITDDEISKIAQPSLDRVDNVGSSIEKMLNVFDVNKNLNVQIPFQEALSIYPELLNDLFCKTKLREKIKSLIKNYKAGKLEVNGKYLFILPDLYAACEYWFCQIKKPKGLLADKEVYCKVYNKAEKLACLRSPHLYREWAIRKNKVNEDTKKWFKTSALYTSSYDLISKLLQFDVDGDKSLVIHDDLLISIAERNMEGIVPLFYNMYKAEAGIIDNEKMYNGMVAAWTGGNIGAISNKITKIWNSGDVTEDKIKTVKWLCAINNYVIDYAKTLYMPNLPHYVEENIAKYTKYKMPYFFQYAKEYKNEQIAPKNDSFVNKLDDLFKYKRLNFRKLAKFDYKVLMNNPKIELDNDMIEKFDKLNKAFFYKLNYRIIKTADRDYYTIQELRTELAKFNHSTVDIVDMLVKYMFDIRNTQYKSVLWLCYGSVIVRNIFKNVNIREPYCMRCGKRMKPLKAGERKHKYCDECMKEIAKETKPHPIQTEAVCVDCGKVFKVNTVGRKRQRCDECQIEYVRKKEREKKRRQKAKREISPLIN